MMFYAQSCINLFKAKSSLDGIDFDINSLYANNYALTV